MFGFFKKKKGSSDQSLLKLLKDINSSGNYRIYGPNELAGIEHYEDLKKSTDDEKKELINRLSVQIGKFLYERAKGNLNFSFVSSDISIYGTRVGLAIQSGLLRKNLNYNEEEWIELFTGFKSAIDKVAGNKKFDFSMCNFPVTYGIKQLEYYLKKGELTDELKIFLKEVLKWLEQDADKDGQYFQSNLRTGGKKLRSLLHKEGEVPRFEIKMNDIGEGVNGILDSIHSNINAFSEIFSLAFNVSGGKPSKKFNKEVERIQELIGPDVYRKLAQQILEVPIGLGIEEYTRTYTYSNGSSRDYVEYSYLCGPSQTFMKGIVWTMARYSDKETIRLLGKLCEKSFTKIPGKGPAAAALGNACVYVLGNMRGKDGLGALSRLKLKVRQNNVKKTIDKHLFAGAKKYNVSVEELKEMAVPDFNLTNGQKVVAFEDYNLKIYLEGRKAVQQWIKPDGKGMKSVPSVVKNSSSLTKKLSEIRKEVREIQKVYSAQKQRIDNQFILGRTWDFESFQKYYLNHGLVSPIAKKLVWIFSKEGKQAHGIYLDNGWYTIKNKEIDWIDNSTTVQLWHPVNAAEDEIVAWRDKMIELEWKQPIKQVFREIYLLTDAEVNTRSYSNRMASHILKQHQFSSLANLRNWKYALLGAYDDGRDNETCMRRLPEYGMIAEFWIDELYQEDSWNDAGIWNYVSTDQVKFKNEGGIAIDLIDVPKLVFTEIMRDVDLFVGVSSVGNDPQWMDNNGQRQANRDYWTSYSFGDLSEIAKTRKTILERLLPRLKKIREVATIEGKFLKVKGKLRNYKIHIGSSNILMEPNDQYLCIVPSRSAENSADKIFIPFEGDKGLSIVLSKAFLLAEDDKITDATITSQIGRRRV